MVYLMIPFPQDEKTKLVRTMKPEKHDYAALARCFNSFKDSDSWPGGFGGSFIFTEEWAEDRYKDQIFEPLFVVDAEDDPSKMVGVCLCSRSWDIVDSYYVGILGVDPEYQGQKYGKALLLKGTQFALEKNCRFIGLHTWSGNLKAFPLYRRQGYKWRPGTDVYMVNYIPQILNHPFFKEFFTQNGWYEIFKPVTDQEMDETFDEKMAVYEYFFETEQGDSLNVWIDRTIGRISGFHMKNDNVNLHIQARTPDSQAFIGVEEFPIELKLKNNGLEKLSISLSVSATSDIIFSGEKQANLALEPNEEKVINYTGSFISGTDELDIKTHPQAFSTHEIKFEIIVNESTFPITLGKIPKNAIDVLTYPKNFITKPDSEIILPIEIQNFTGVDKEDILVEVVGSDLLSFEESIFNILVSKYDSLLKIPLKVGKTPSMVDYFDITVSQPDGTVIISRKLPIIIFDKNKALSYEIGEEVFLENRDIRLSFYKGYNVKENRLTVIDKNRNLKRDGYNMVLGYPFDTEGSEFYTKQLDHTINIAEDGLWLHSSAFSDSKPGIKFTRKFFVPNDDSPFGIYFNIENTSQDLVDNLGAKTEYWWWRGSRFEKYILHLKEGIKEFNFPEIQIDHPNKPSDFQEGWNCQKYLEGYIGCLYDLTKADKIYGNSIEEKVPDLKTKQSFETSKIWFCFTDSWQQVQQKWREKYLNTPDTELALMRELDELKTVGLYPTETSEYRSKGIVLKKGSKEMFVKINTFKESEMKGSIQLDFNNLIIKPEEKTIDKTRTSSLLLKFEIEPLTRRLYSGKMVFNTLSAVYENSIAIGVFDESKNITIKEEQQDEKSYYEVDNGFLRFKGSSEHRGQIFELCIDNDSNYLKSFFPKVVPFVWTNEFYGGIGGGINVLNQWKDHDYNRLKFKAFIIKENAWEGIGFQSNIIEYAPSLKGLQVTNHYLTLPDSPFLLHQQIIKNHSSAIKRFDSIIDISVKTTGGPDDEYYVESGGKVMKFNLNEHQSYVGSHHDTHAKWVAYKNAKHDYIIGSVILSNKYYTQISPYTPNYSYATLGCQTKKIKLEPQEEITLNVLYILTEDLASIAPFAQTNIEEYLNKK